ncbi:MAG: hypothetical protein L3J37_11145 [Rhodobacteraceae bacterium]|nr:hypothetical protein [Paracoccaceae bacterium]
MDLSFKTLSIVSAAIAGALFLTLLFVPGLVFWLFQIPASDSAVFLARRAAVLFLGFGIIMWRIRDVEASPAIQAICVGWGVAMLGLAALGSMEFLRGFAGIGIFAAVAIETFLGVSYLRLALKMRQPD